MGYCILLNIATKTEEDAERIHEIHREWCPIAFQEEPNMQRGTVLGINPANPKSANVHYMWLSKKDFASHAVLPWNDTFREA
jgi:hypothetical protein